MAKSQTSSQMNLSGSSSSLTSEASTKAGTVSLRSYGIGGAFLHKKMLQLTRRQSRKGEEQGDKEKEEEKRTTMEREERLEKAEEVLCPEQQRGTRLILQRARAGCPAEKRAGSREVQLVIPPEARPTHSQPKLLLRVRSSESPIRKGLMSWFRIKRERSESRERPDLETPQDERLRQAGKRSRRSRSPNTFFWLCGARRGRTEED